MKKNYHTKNDKFQMAHIRNKRQKNNKYHSYGFILIIVDSMNVEHVLLVCRKDTVGFIELIKGNYNSINDIHYFMNMLTKDELMFLLDPNNTFEKAYTRVWKTHHFKMNVLNEINSSVSSNEQMRYFEKDKSKYELNKFNFEKIAKDLLKDNRGWDDCEWGFPKGKIENNEESLQCALRELEEETGICTDKIKIYPETYSECHYEEQTQKEFINTYHIGYMNVDNINNIQTNIQKSEICEIKIVPLSNAIQMIRPYTKDRIKILTDLQNKK